MDMALCTYTPEKNLLEFAGAKNPLIYIKNNTFYKIKGDVKPIGGMLYDKTEKVPFQNHSILIDEPTIFYIFSDGYIDQIGEASGRKFMTTRFKELLMQIHELPMVEQKNVLKEILEKWRGNLPQVDDVMVIGFKLFPK
jgi:serine phosphatase RsbU (regulator of sigma subunit)